MRKRITSLLLTLVMLLSLVPAMGVTASAAATGDGSKGNPFVVTTYEDWKEKMELPGDKYIKLGADIDTSTMNGGYGLGPNDFVSAIGRSYLDLNGKKLTLKKAQLESGVSGTYFIRLIAGELIIDDSKGGGEIVGVNNVTRRYMQLIDVTRDTKLTLNSGRLYLECNPDSDTPNATILFSGTVEINGGTVSVSKWGEWDEPAAYIIRQNFALQAAGKTSSCCALINGGTFDGRVLLGAIAKDSGVADNVITGGDFKKSIYIQKDEEKTGDVPLNVSIQGGTYHYTPGYMTVTSGENAGKRESNPLHLFQFATMGFRDDMVYCDDVVYDAFKGGSLFEPDKYDMNAFASMFPKNVIITAEGQEYDYYDARYDEPQHISVNDAAFTGSSSALELARLVNSHYKTITVTTLPEDALKDMKLTVGDGTPLPAQGNSTVSGDVTLGSDGTLTEDVYITARGNKQLKEMYYSSPSKIDFGYRLNIFKDGVRVTDYTGDSLTYAALGDEISVSVQLRNFEFEEGVYTFRLALWPYLRGSEAQIGETLVGLWKLTAKEDVDLPIDSVTLNVPELKVGDTPADFTLSGTNTGVSAVTTEWEDIPPTGAVESTFYSARITLTAEDGYAFNTKTQVNLNGDYSSKGSGIDNGGAGMTIYVSVPVRHEHTFSGEWQNLNNDKEYHFKTCSCGAQTKEPHNLEYNETLDKYQCICGYWINGTKTEIQFVAASPRSPIDGESPSNYTPEQWVHNIGKNYTVVSIDWKDEDGNAVTTFESGKIYKGTVTFKADDEFKFDKDRIQFDRIFNTSTTETVEGYNLDEGATTLIATFKLKDNTVVRPGLNVKVKLPTLNDKIGQSLPEAELVDTTLPDDVELTTSVYENILDDPITGSVAPNKTYFYAVWLKLGNNDSVEAITKKYNVSYTVTDGGDAEYHTDNVAGYGVLARYQTPNAADTSKISSVALTVTAPKYGEAPATTATGANDNLYTVGTPTWTPAEPDGKFGADTYTVSIPVTAESGYSFDANCVYTVNGYLATYADADGKVSYTFPALTAPHEHSYGTWTMVDNSQHSRSCTCGDVQFQDHTLVGNWKPDSADNTKHYKECDVCKGKVEAPHVESSKITVIPAGIGTEGTWKTECVDCSKPMNTGTFPALTAISAVNVTVTAPVKGAAPGTATTADATYDVAATDWDPIVSGTFAGGTKYTVKVSLEATGNNRFTDTTTFKINGKAATIVTKRGEEAVITLTFDATEGTPAATEYTVTVKDDGNGTASANHVKAVAGTEIKLTATPNSGYHFKEWKVVKGGVIIKDNKFTMPADNVEVKAIFEKNSSTGGGGGGGVTTYSITVKSSKNGDVTASHKSASKGTTVTLTVDPDKGYVLDTLTVLDGKDKEIKLTEKNGKYTFTMPASKVTVEAMFKAAGNNPFIDVPAGSYYEDAVIWAVDKGITTGTSATTFNPNGICTRAQAVTFLWRAAGSPAAKSAVMPFTDVKAGSYYYDAVLWAVENGITKGTSDTTFSPDATCSRAQIVTFLWRANGSPAVSGNSAFTDVAADAYYAAAVTWAEKNDITGGIGGGLFGSNNNCTRAQIVTFIYRNYQSK